MRNVVVAALLLTSGCAWPLAEPSFEDVLSAARDDVDRGAAALRAGDPRREEEAGDEAARGAPGGRTRFFLVDPPPFVGVGLESATLSVGDRRRWRRLLLEEVRGIFARRLDVRGLPRWTPLTVWLEDGRIVGVEIERDEALGGPVLAALVEGDAAQVEAGFYDERGLSLSGPFLARPVEGYITSRRGVRMHPILRRRRFHAGTDYAAPRGADVVVVGDGTVAKIGRDRTRGNHVVVRHANGMISTYMHLDAVDEEITRRGRVARGQRLGAVGMTGLATGPHLHFELRWRGRGLDASTLEWPPGPALPPDLRAAHEARVEALRAQAGAASTSS